jgi:hypothetical protein
MDDKFVELVKKESEKRQKGILSAKAIERRRNWWIKEVTDLFDKVKSWLNPLIEDGALEFETSDLQINEEWLGLYTVKRAVIRLGVDKLEMTPVGTIILGSFGRIDLKGPNDERMLILEATPGTEETNFEPKDGQWFIVKREQNRRFKSELTKATFEQLFMGLFGINAL